MQTNDHFHEFHAFDYVPATWGFIRDRFARQCKALKRLTGRTTAQCYDLIAQGGGFRAWPQMSSTMDVLEAIERYSEALFYAEEETELPAALKTARAAVNVFGEAPRGFWLGENGALNGRAVTAALSRARRVRDLADYDENALLDGLDVFAELRFAFCVQATWCGHTRIIGQSVMDTLELVHGALTVGLGSETQADAALEAMYGAVAWWDPELDIEFQLIDQAARMVLAGRTAVMPPDLARAYLLADDGGWQSVETWRQLLREAAPHSLDVTSENGPLTALVLNNAPPDAAIWVRLAELALDGTPRAYYFVTDGQIWVPTAELVAPAAACSGAPPQHTLAVTPEIAQAYELPSTEGYLLTWD